MPFPCLWFFGNKIYFTQKYSLLLWNICTWKITSIISLNNSFIKDLSQSNRKLNVQQAWQPCYYYSHFILKKSLLDKLHICGDTHISLHLQFKSRFASRALLPLYNSPLHITATLSLYFLSSRRTPSLR